MQTGGEFIIQGSRTAHDEVVKLRTNKEYHSVLHHWCVCRVCVTHDFYAFYSFPALIESVTYGNMEALKVQVPLRHFQITDPILTATACFSFVSGARYSSPHRAFAEHAVTSYEARFCPIVITMKVARVFFSSDAD